MREEFEHSLTADPIKTVGIVSLGCDKNRVDSENLLFYIKEAGFEIAGEASKARIIIVNTCAFIESARRESIDTVLEMAEYKKPPRACEKLLVAGCFPVRHLKELKENLPEVDAFVSFSDYGRIGAVINSLYETESGCDKNASTTAQGDATQGDGVLVSQCKPVGHNTPSPCVAEARDPAESRLLGDGRAFSAPPGRIVSTPRHYAYLKIAEGCDNRCTYCTIPSIRGPYRSRDKESLLREAETLADGGVREIILVAQDTTRYGSDLSPKNRGGAGLIDLADSISRIGGIEWIRLMYCYPELAGKDLIDFVAGNGKVVKYLDIPLQHSEDRILKAMGRRVDGTGVRRLLDMVKAAPQKIALRSSFIVGFPGETEEEFAALCAFLKEYKIDNAGFFGYSREEGTPAYKLPGGHTKAVIRKRVAQAGRIQKEIIRENNMGLIGKTVKVLYEGIDYDKNKLYGRTQYNAPEIDTYVYFDADFADAGHFYDIMITGVSRDGFDLKGIHASGSARNEPPPTLRV